MAHGLTTSTCCSRRRIIAGCDVPFAAVAGSNCSSSRFIDSAKSFPSEPGSASQFRVFVIDTGWNEVAHKVLRKQIPLFDTLIGDAPICWLDRPTSVTLLRKHRELIGCDPIVCVHDLRAVKRRGTLGVHGLRLHLRLLRNEDALTRALQMVMRFLARDQVSNNFEAEVRSRLQLEALKCAIAIMAGNTPHNDFLKM
jgi:hypothetical protein